MTSEIKSNNPKPSKRGGVRAGAGRPKGRKNLLSAELKELAQTHGEAALNTIVEVMLTGEPSMRLAASKELLDRGYGKSVQAVDANVSGALGLNLNVTFG